MLIESTYSVPAPSTEVFAALLNPDVVCRALPGCERLIQLGPAEDDGTITWEVRLRLGPEADLYTATVKTERLRRPTHLGLSARGQGPDGPFTARGSLELVNQDGRTVVAYVWDAAAGVPSGGERRGIDEAAAAQLAQTACERFAAELRRSHSNGNELAEALPMLRADTARGKIILLPPEPASPPLSARMRQVARGSVWAGAGLLAGLLAIALAASIIRRRGAGTDGDAAK
jgi:carbon monoxide dehydrogenase subunit G